MFSLYSSESSHVTATKNLQRSTYLGTSACAKCVVFVTKADHRSRSGSTNAENGGEIISDGSTAATFQPQTVSVIAMDELRETLLTDK